MTKFCINSDLADLIAQRCVSDAIDHYDWMAIEIERLHNSLPAYSLDPLSNHRLESLRNGLARRLAQVDEILAVQAPASVMQAAE